ncbi:MAG: hypothetical protein ACK41F_11805 [Fimbriimonadaceae bacterium]
MIVLALSGYLLVATGFYVLMCRTARYREEEDSGIPKPGQAEIIDLEAARSRERRAA